MNSTQLLIVIKQGKQGLKTMRAIDCAIDKCTPFEVSEIPFQDRINFELARIDLAERKTVDFFTPSQFLETLKDWLKIPSYLARLSSTLSSKTASYLRGIFQRIVDTMTFKNRDALSQSTSLFTILKGIYHANKKTP